MNADSKWARYLLARIEEQDPKKESMGHHLASLLVKVADRAEMAEAHSAFNAYQDKAMSTSGDNGRPPESEHTKWIMIAALGLAGEAGEVADLFKKQFEQGREIRRDALVKELGDVLWYIARIASIEGIQMSEIATANIEKLAARYPGGFVPGGGIR